MEGTGTGTGTNMWITCLMVWFHIRLVRNISFARWQAKRALLSLNPRRQPPTHAGLCRRAGGAGAQAGAGAAAGCEGGPRLRNLPGWSGPGGLPARPGRAALPGLGKRRQPFPIALCRSCAAAWPPQRPLAVRAALPLGWRLCACCLACTAWLGELHARPNADANLLAKCAWPPTSPNTRAHTQSPSPPHAHRPTHQPHPITHPPLLLSRPGPAASTSPTSGGTRRQASSGGASWRSSPRSSTGQRCGSTCRRVGGRCTASLRLV